MKVRGPYHNKATDLWKIQLVHDDGRTTEINKKSKAEIDKTKAQVLALSRVSSASTKSIRHRAPDGTLGWYSEALDKISKRVLRDPADATLGSAAKVFCRLILAKKQCINQREIEDRIQAAEETLIEITHQRDQNTHGHSSHTKH